MKNIVFLFTIITVFFLSCEQETIATLETSTPVVDAYLYAGQTIDSIQISQSFSYARQDTTLITLNDLQVTLDDGSNIFDLTNIGDGFYTNKSITVQAGINYTLNFEFEGRNVRATTYIPEQKEVTMSTDAIEMPKIESGSFPFGGGFTFPDPVELTWDNPEGDYYYVLVQNIEEDPEFINDLFADPDLPLRRLAFITEPEITDFYAIDARRQIQQFGTHQVIIFRVNPEYAALYASSGSSSSQTITSPPTNIEEGLGIFTGVSSDTLYLEVRRQ